MKKKQITFLSAIVILVAGTIGSGIFFKNGSLFKLGHGHIMLVLAAWIIAAAGIIALGIGIAEMSLRANGKKGVLEWTKKFMPKKMHYSSKNFVQLIFIPIILFALPLYEVKALNQAGVDLNAWQEFAVGFAIFTWFAVMSFVSVKAGEVTQWIVMGIKFIPLVVLPIWAMTQTGDYAIAHKTVSTQTGLSGVGGGFMILIAGLSAIAFAFDGFYSVTTLKDNMKNPKKMSSVIALGLAIVTAFYLFVTLGFGLGSKDGTHTNMGLSQTSLKAFSALIAIGILGVVNGYAQFGTNTYISLHEDDESWYTRTWEKIVNRNGRMKKRTVAFIAMYSTTAFMFILFTLIGIYAWHEDSIQWYYYGHQHTADLIGFVNTLTNYKSLLMFTLIATALVFALPIIRSEIDSSKKKLLITVLSIMGIAIIYAAGTYTIIAAIVDMTGYNHANKSVALVKFMILIGVIGISTTTGLVEYNLDVKNKRIISESA